MSYSSQDLPGSESFDDSVPTPNSASSGDSHDGELSPGSESHFEKTDHSPLDSLSDLSDIRQDRVTALQKAIESGTYSIPTEKLAEKLLHEILISSPEDPTALS